MAHTLFKDRYRFEATSIEGLIQQVAVSYIRHGYLYWVSGTVPPGKDPTLTDEKLFMKYNVRISRWAREEKRAKGEAVQHYVRHGRFFVLLSTPGWGRFFEEERPRCFKKHALRYGVYQVSYRLGHDRKWHAHVSIEDSEYERLKAYALHLAVHRTSSALEAFFFTLPYASYAPVRRQLFNLLRAVNRMRKIAGFEVVSKSSIRLKREIVRPFEAPDKELRVA